MAFLFLFFLDFVADELVRRVGAGRKEGKMFAIGNEKEYAKGNYEDEEKMMFFEKEDIEASTNINLSNILKYQINPQNPQFFQKTRFLFFCYFKKPQGHFGRGGLQVQLQRPVEQLLLDFGCGEIQGDRGLRRQKYSLRPQDINEGKIFRNDVSWNLSSCLFLSFASNNLI
jgi:hypothetical protein